MDLAGFLEGLGRMRGPELRAVSAALVEQHRSAGDEIDAWHRLTHVDAVLRREGRRRVAANAATLAAATVRDVARRCEIDLPDADVTRVAREAALTARAIVAGEAAATDALSLVREFAPSFAAA